MLLLLSDIYTPPMIVSIILPEKAPPAQFDITMEIEIVIDVAGVFNTSSIVGARVFNISSIEAVFVGKRCGRTRRGSGRDINSLTRAVAISKPGLVNLCVRNIVLRTVGLRRLVGKMVVH
jgi:hypothetical protein